MKHANRKKAEGELGRLNAESYLDIAEVILTVLDAKGVLTLINRKGCQVLGYRKEEIVGKNWYETCLPPEAAGRVSEAVNKAMAEGLGSFEFNENDIVTKNGERRTIAWHNAVIRDKDGKAAGLLSSGEDITERKKAEDALRKYEEENLAVVNAVCDMLFRVRRDGVITGCRASLESGLHAPSEAFLGKNIREVLPRQVSMQAMDAIEKAIQSHEIVTFEHELFWEGKQRFYEDKVVMLSHDEVLSIVRDITNCKSAEAAIRQSEQKLKLHLEQTPLAVIYYDTKYRVIYWNHAAERILGYSSSEALGRHVDFILPDYVKDRVDHIFNLMLRGHSSEENTNENITKDGEKILCHWYNTPVLCFLRGINKKNIINSNKSV